MQVIKSLPAFVLAALLSVGAAWAATPPASAAAAAAPLKGTVLETKDVDPYTYLSLKTKDGETWAAVGKAPVKVGAEVTIENPAVMKDFEEQDAQAHRFDRIVFGTLAGAGPAPTAAPAGDMAAMHANLAKPVEIADVKVAKGDRSGRAHGRRDRLRPGRAEGQARRRPRQGREVHARSDGQELDSPARRHGLGHRRHQRRPRHVQGHGEDRRRRAGQGRRAHRRDLGSGYSYKVLVEEATLQK